MALADTRGLGGGIVYIFWVILLEKEYKIINTKLDMKVNIYLEWENKLQQINEGLASQVHSPWDFFLGNLPEMHT